MQTENGKDADYVFESEPRLVHEGSKIELDAQAAIDLADRGSVADAYMSLGRCVGGRVVSPTHMCPHCGSTDPSERCLAPLDVRRKR